MASVLIVDDEKSILELFRFIFSEAGHEVATAADGREALERVSASVPDFIVLDVAMPGMDGKGFIAGLSALAAEDRRFADIPFVVMTGENFLESGLNKDFASVPGFAGFFPKMTPPEEVLAAMETALAAGAGPADKTVLAVDDDPGMRALYSALFSEAGFAVDTAADADAGLEKFMSARPDLLVLDVAMPAGGGQKIFDITRRILQSGVPVIFVTGFPKVVLDSALFHKNVVVLEKPVDEARLLAEARRLTGEA